MRTISLHITEEEREKKNGQHSAQGWHAQIMMRSVTSFIQVTWKIHVRILRPIVVREKRAPAHNN
jgi:hypothetical protein